MKVGREYWEYDNLQIDSPQIRYNLQMIGIVRVVVCARQLDLKDENEKNLHRIYPNVSKYSFRFDKYKIEVKYTIHNQW